MRGGAVTALLLAGLAAGYAASCSGEEAPDPGGQGVDAGATGGQGAADDGAGGAPAAGGQGGPALPETPRLPATLRVEVDGAALTAARAEELLASEWTAFVAGPEAPADADARVAAFFGAPRARCATLLAETAIAREAARRFPELDAGELARQEERLRAGGRLTWFETVHGPEAARAFVERFERRRLLEAQYAELAEEVPEEEVFAVYEREILAELPPAAEREGLDVSFATHGPRIRERLQRERGLDDLQAWAAGRAAEMELVVVLPDGTRVE